MIRDSVYEMMTELQYQAFAGKAKNGGKSPALASEEFKAMRREPSAVTDELGPTVEYKSRVAVK
eukprot:5378230-Alexandrium_andersonii.AAC.1